MRQEFLVVICALLGVTLFNTWLKLSIFKAQLACFSIVGVGFAIDAPIAVQHTILLL
ncbi:MAG: hypothetical protein ABDH19_03160 [Thermodesulfovibrio sp.]